MHEARNFHGTRTRTCPSVFINNDQIPKPTIQIGCSGPFHEDRNECLPHSVCRKGDAALVEFYQMSKRRGRFGIFHAGSTAVDVIGLQYRNQETMGLHRTFQSNSIPCVMRVHFLRPNHCRGCVHCDLRYGSFGGVFRGRLSLHVPRLNMATITPYSSGCSWFLLDFLGLFGLLGSLALQTCSTSFNLVLRALTADRLRGLALFPSQDLALRLRLLSSFFCSFRWRF